MKKYHTIWLGFIYCFIILSVIICSEMNRKRAFKTLKANVVTKEAFNVVGDILFIGSKDNISVYQIETIAQSCVVVSGKEAEDYGLNKGSNSVAISCIAK